MFFRERIKFWEFPLCELKAQYPNSDLNIIEHKTAPTLRFTLNNSRGLSLFYQIKVELFSIYFFPVLNGIVCKQHYFIFSYISFFFTEHEKWVKRLLIDWLRYQQTVSFRACDWTFKIYNKNRAKCSIHMFIQQNCFYSHLLFYVCYVFVRLCISILRMKVNTIIYH